MKKLTLVLLSFALINTSAAQQLSQKATQGAVVSVDRYASEAGVEILKQGGNAVDAAITTAFVLAVTHPFAGNIGGGGFMLVRMANGEAACIDYRETAPARAKPAMFLDKKGFVDSISSRYGYLVAGVPGTVMGMETAWKTYGSLPWKTLVEPAVKLAEQGIYLNGFDVKELKKNAGALKRFPETRKIFFKADGQPYTEKDLLVQQDLAATLRLIAEKGSAGFYQGEVAQKLVADMKANGGIMTLKDLAGYKAAVREPVEGRYNSYRIISTPPPGSGATLIELLNVLENHDLRKKGPLHPDNVHVMAEAMRLCYFDRARYLGDADFVEIPLKRLISKDHALGLYRKIDMNKAMPSDKLFQDVRTAGENMETTHFSVADKQGNVVANTYTIEEAFGSKAVVKGLGFLLNNQMHDFNIQPKQANMRGGLGTNPNIIEPRKRMLSSMSPTIVLKNGKPFIVTGSPGGRTIINTVMQVIVGVTDFDMDLRGAIDMPRITHHWMPDYIYFEAGRLSGETINLLKTRGHRFSELESIGRANSILIDPKTGEIFGEADGRKGGWASGF